MNMLVRLCVLAALGIVVNLPANAGSVRGDAETLFLRGKWETVTLFRFSGPGTVSGESFGNTYLTTVPLPDGQYSYEVWGYNEMAGRGLVTTDEHDINQRLDNGRDPGARPSRAQPETKLEDGYFQMLNGQVFVDNGEVER
jgi:hypothetical protein